MDSTEATPSNVGEWRWWVAGYGVRVAVAMIVGSAASAPLLAAINDLILVMEGSGPSSPETVTLLFFFVGVLVVGGGPSVAAVLLFSRPDRRSIIRCLLVGPGFVAAVMLLFVAVWTPGLLNAHLDPVRVIAWFARPLAITATVTVVFVGVAALLGVIPRRGSQLTVRGSWDEPARAD